MGKKSSAEAQLDAILGKTKKKQGKGKKNRKIGRYSKSPSCARYRSEKRWLTNKERKLKKHVKRQPGDVQARSALVSLFDSAANQKFLASVPA